MTTSALAYNELHTGAMLPEQTVHVWKANLEAHVHRIAFFTTC